MSPKDHENSIETESVGYKIKYLKKLLMPKEN